MQPWRAETFRFSTDPRAGRQGHRRGRAVPGPAGERDRAVRGREVPDPGAGPDRADAADAARAGRAPLPRLRPARHHDPVRRAGDRHRQGHRARCKPRHRHQEFLAFLKQVARAYPDTTRAAPGDGQLRRPQAPRGPRLAGREPADPRALHPDPRLLDEPGRGLVLASSNAKPSTAAPSAPSTTSTPRSAPSSTAGTTAATPSSGPRPPTRSSRKPTVRRPQTRGTSNP